jgi:hypothetical protein
MTSSALADGVYLNLPEEEYFAQDALGSTDFIRLWLRRHGWWWSSRYNPHKKITETDAQNYGSALHKIVLEGVDAYERRFAVIPDRPAGAVSTIDEMRAKLADVGLRGVSKFRAEDWAWAMREHRPDVPCWPNILADFDDEAGTRPRITSLENSMLRLMRDAMMESPDIARLFDDQEGRPPLAEVSVLATLPSGIRRRWRFDRLFPAFTMDLKSLAGAAHRRSLPWAVGDRIAAGGYDIQRADYDVGRKVMLAFIENGFQVFGGDLDQRSWLRRFVDFPEWDWVWLFYQKPDPAGFAPVVFPVMDFQKDPTDRRRPSQILRSGRHKLAQASAFYGEMVGRFGLDRPWTHVEDLHYTDEGLEPRVFLPHWLEDGVPPESEFDDPA